MLIWMGGVPREESAVWSWRLELEWCERKILLCWWLEWSERKLRSEQGLAGREVVVAAPEEIYNKHSRLSVDSLGDYFDSVLIFERPLSFASRAGLARL